MRLGTYYRALVFKNLGISPNGKNVKSVLDVGCYDGYFLSKVKAKEKAGIDLSPIKKYKNIKYIKGDIYKLNFKNKFDRIFAFDVLEHVDNDKLFLESLIKLLKQEGIIILSTPHKEMQIFPSFLTNYVNKKWGHYRTHGYLESEIRNLLPKNTNINAEFIYRKEIFYRTFYLFLRLMWGISESMTKPFVRFIEFLDSIKSWGQKGHLFIILSRKNGKK